MVCRLVWKCPPLTWTFQLFYMENFFSFNASFFCVIVLTNTLTTQTENYFYFTYAVTLCRVIFVFITGSYFWGYSLSRMPYKHGLRSIDVCSLEACTHMTLKQTTSAWQSASQFSHFSHAVKTYLDHHSPGSWIDCGRPHLPFRSHHTCLDFYLWECLTYWCTSRNR